MSERALAQLANAFHLTKKAAGKITIQEASHITVSCSLGLLSPCRASLGFVGSTKLNHIAIYVFLCCILEIMPC